MERSCIVYALVSSEDGAIRYVGQTISSAHERLRQHVKRSRRAQARTHRDNWIRRVLSDGYSVEIMVLEQNAIWNIDERRWISALRADGTRLVNATEGGEGCLDAPIELRAKIGATVKKTWSDPELRAKHRAAKLGVPWSEKRRTVCEMTPKEVRSSRAARGRLKLTSERRSEISAEAARQHWRRQKAQGLGRGEMVNSAKLTEYDVRRILAELNETVSMAFIAQEYGVSRACIRKIRDGLTWTHIERESAAFRRAGLEEEAA